MLLILTKIQIRIMQIKYITLLKQIIIKIDSKKTLIIITIMIITNIRILIQVVKTRFIQNLLI